MAKIGKALAALGAVAGGMVKGEMALKDESRREEEDRRRRDEHHIRLDTVQREKDDRLALSTALRPVTMQEGAGGATLPDTMDNRDVGQPGEQPVQPGGYQVQGKNFTDRAQAEIALSAANSPQAKGERVALALEGRSKPLEALQYRQHADKFADEAWERGLREAMTRGHDGIAEFMTRAQGGVLKGKTIKAVPDADGKTVTYHIAGGDGTSTPTRYTMPADQNGVIQAAYQLSKVSPETRYKNMVEEDRKAAAAAVKEREISLRERNFTEVQQPLAEARIALAEAKVATAGNKGSDGTSREERLRWTSLQESARKRLDDANKTMRTLQGNTLFMLSARKPGTQEAQQLADLQNDIAGYKDDLSLYGGLLAGPKGAEARAARDAGKPKPATEAKPGAVAAPTSKVEYDALPSGARYRHPDGTVKIKK